MHLSISAKGWRATDASMPTTLNMAVTTPILTGRLKIRRFELADIDSFVEFMTDTESTRYLAFDDEQKTRNGASKLIESTIRAYDSDRPMLAFAVEERSTGSFVGFCGLYPHDQTVLEIMYAVMPHARRRGYATEIARAVAQYALDDLGYAKVVAPIAFVHSASKTVALRAGFKDFGVVKREPAGEKMHQFIFEYE